MAGAIPLGIDDVKARTFEHLAPRAFAAGIDDRSNEDARHAK
jgi:hypothetical protein